MKLFSPSIFILQRKYKTIIQSSRVQQNPLHSHHSSVVEEITMYRKTLMPKSHQCRASMRQCCTSKCLSSYAVRWHHTPLYKHSHTQLPIYTTKTPPCASDAHGCLPLWSVKMQAPTLRAGLSKCVTFSRLNVYNWANTQSNWQISGTVYEHRVQNCLEKDPWGC